MNCEEPNIIDSLSHLPRFVATGDSRNNNMKVYEKARLTIDSGSKYEKNNTVELYIAGVAVSEKNNEPYGLFISSFYVTSKDDSRIIQGIPNVFLLDIIKSYETIEKFILSTSPSA